jgi:predicted Zn-dependent protease
MLDGDLDRAEEMCRQTFDVATSDAPSTAAHAQALLGQILAERGDIEVRCGVPAGSVLLDQRRADNDAAQLWFELADLLEDVGDLDAARQAYRSAAASTGLRSGESRRQREDQQQKARPPLPRGSVRHPRLTRWPARQATMPSAATNVVASATAPIRV